MTCTLVEEECRGLREEFGKEGMGSDHGHDRVSTYAGITITIVYPKSDDALSLLPCGTG